MKRAVIFTQFDGGISTDDRIGPKNSAAYLQSFNHRDKPSQLSATPAPTREDAGVVKDLVLNEVMVPDGSIYAVGDGGYIYHRTTAGVWSNFGNLSSGTSGMDYRRDTDSIYLTGNKTVSQITTITTTPTLIPGKYGVSYSTYNNSTNAGFNVNAYQAGSILTTTLKTSIDELKPDLRYFQSDIEPLNKISVYVVTKGTGDWTLTLHDGDNNVLGTATVTNANLKNAAFNDFVFSKQIRIYIAPNARTYHIHLTSTVADGKVASSSTNDLSTADLEVWADRLVQTNNGWHPMTRFLQYECIQNGNYLSIWEPISDPPTNDEWQRHKLVFPMEYEGCGIDKTNEFLIMALEKTTTSPTNQTPQEGLIAFWDGLSATYNYVVPVPEGSPYGMHVYKNVIYYFAGGAWWAMTSPMTQPIKIRTLPGSGTDFSGTNSPILLYPNAATVRRGVQYFSYPGSTTNTAINFGVYSWGSVDKNFQESLGYDFTISTGSRNYSAQNNLKIGMVRAYGDVLHISWRDDQNGGYGVDVVDNNSKPSATSVWRSLVYDRGFAQKAAEAEYINAYYYLKPGSTITLAYSVDQGPWVSSDAYSTTNLWQGRPNMCQFSVTDLTNGQGGTFHELQIQVTVTHDGTSATSSTVQSIAFIYDDRVESVL